MHALSKALVVLLLTILMEINATAQVETHLYLFQVEQVEDCYAVSKPRYISSFNPCGYTDQPSFTPLGDVLVSAKMAGDDQHDIWLISTETGSYKRLTQTSANEFSPRVTPDGRCYSVVRQVKGDTTSQVWQFPVFGGKYKSITPKVGSVGNYAWINENEIGLFCKEGSQSRLATYNKNSQTLTRLITSLGTTMISDRMGSLYYIHKYNGTAWYLKQYNHDSHNIDIINETPVKSEVMGMSPDGTFFMGKDSKIYSYQPGSSTWKECADLSMFGIHQISRIAISPDGKHMALVAICE